MNRCCEVEAKKHVRRHRDVAVCDGCGRLVLGYGNEAEWKKTQDELGRNKVAFEAAKLGALWIVAKDRAPAGAVEDDDDADDDEDDEDESS
jgi:hypothetical protein